MLDPTTVLWVRLQNVNGVNGNWNNPIHRNVLDIEIIDGANVLYSVSGIQAWALACAQLGQAPLQRFSALGGDIQTMEIPIMFGRYWGDREYAFDATKFQNPQLRVRYNMATVNPIGVTGFTTLTTQLTVLAEVMEGAAAPRALLMAKEHYTWTSAVGWEYIDLPRDYPYQAMMYRSHLAATHPYGVVGALRLRCDAGKVTPFEVSAEDLIHLMMVREPKLEYRISDHLANGGTFTSYLEELEDVAMIYEGAAVDVLLHYQNFEYGSQIVNVYRAGVAEPNRMNVGVHVHGYCPFGYIHVPFGDPKVPSDWFQAKTFGSVRLEALGVVGAGACDLVLVQERPY
jgi:hypothetical protein